MAGLRPHGRAGPPRQVHGGLLKDKQFIQGFIADSYIDIQSARLMTIHAAEKIDEGLDAARTDISAIKVFVPAAYQRVVDRAIQVWGAAGVSNDLPLAGMYHGRRTLRIADGPDEVHRILIAKNVLGRYQRPVLGLRQLTSRPKIRPEASSNGTRSTCGRPAEALIVAGPWTLVAPAP